MRINHYAGFILLAALLVMTGCVPKISLPTIDQDLKPVVKLSGKVHVKPVADHAKIIKFTNGYYTTNSGSNETRFQSSTQPVEMIGKSVVTCLTQSGLMVTTGTTVPADAEIVLAPEVQKVYVGTRNPYWLANIAVSAATGVFTSSAQPRSIIVVNNSFEDRLHQVSVERMFTGNEVSHLSMTNASGGERSFRLVQEAYCGWLQRQIADLQTKPGQEQKKAENKEQ